MRPLVLFLLLLAGCAPFRPAPQPVAIDPLPLIQNLVDRASSVRSLRGLAVVAVESPEGDFRGRQALVAAMPDRLRAETLSMFGSPLMIVTVDAKRLRAWLPTRRSFYAGRADAAGLARLLRLRTTPRQIVRLLHHRPDVPLDHWTGHRTADGYQLVRQDAGEVTRLVFDSAKRLVRFELASGANVLIRADWSRFDDQDGFPRSLSLNWPVAQRRMQLTFKSLELNPDLPADIFSLAPPAGADFYLLDGDPE